MGLSQMLLLPVILYSPLLKRTRGIINLAVVPESLTNRSNVYDLLDDIPFDPSRMI